MPDLQQIRQEIDANDREILACIEKRMALTEQVARYKIDHGKQIHDPEREREKLQKVRDAVSDPFSSKAIQEVFQQLMSISRKQQYRLLDGQGKTEPVSWSFADTLPASDKEVVFQGEEGAYSQAAMKKFFGENVRSTHVETWRQAMELVVSGKNDYAVLPIENSTAGNVSDIFDLINEYPVYIVGEQILKIEHRLMSVPGADPAGIRRVISHPQALSQCRTYLDGHKDWSREARLNTAAAAKEVAEKQDPSLAAIASEAAAKQFGLEILEKGRLSTETNATRFIVVSAEEVYVKGADKISICVELAHTSGSLYSTLAHFIYNNLNMTNITSRPIPGRNWEYRFFIDFEGNLNDPAVRNALRGLQTEARMVRVLGNYPDQYTE